MYSNISNDAKNTLKSNVVTLTARITLTSNNQVIDGNYLQNITITDQCYENGVIIGTAMAKEAEIELIDNSFDLADKEFSLEVGVLLPNNTYEYIPYGNFIVKEYKKIISSGHYKLIAYDYMDKLNTTFIDSYDYSTPITLQQFYENLAIQYGLEIEEQLDLPNSDFIVSEKPYFEGMSGRIVLSRIAEMMGCFAKINRSNKIEMRFKNITSEQFSRDVMNNSLERDEMFGPINVVSLRLSQVEGENVTVRDETSIAQYGETILQISDNPFVNNEALRLLAIDDIYNQIDGFSYYPTTFNAKLIYLDCGDEVGVQDMNTDSYYSTIILKQVLKIPSARNSKFENKAITKTGLEYQFTPEQKRANSRTEYLVDKQNENIKQLIEKTDSSNDEINILKTRMVSVETNEQGFEIQLNNIINNGVSKVETSMGYTFDDEGLKINKSNAETGTIIDEAAIKVIDKTSYAEQDLLYAGYVKEGNINYSNYVGQTIVYSKNMIVDNFLVIPNSRFEAYVNPVLGGHGTGIFGI